MRHSPTRLMRLTRPLIGLNRLFVMAYQSAPSAPKEDAQIRAEHIAILARSRHSSESDPCGARRHEVLLITSLPVVTLACLTRTTTALCCMG